LHGIKRAGRYRASNSRYSSDWWDGDKPLRLGTNAALTSAGVIVDFIGSDEQVMRELLANPRVNFHNLRGDQRPQVSGDERFASLETIIFG